MFYVLYFLCIPFLHLAIIFKNYQCPFLVNYDDICNLSVLFLIISHAAEQSLWQPGYQHNAFLCPTSVMAGRFDAHYDYLFFCNFL